MWQKEQNCMYHKQVVAQMMVNLFMATGWLLTTIAAVCGMWTTHGLMTNHKYDYHFYGVRPVVCLPADISASKDGNVWVVEK